MYLEILIRENLFYVKRRNIGIKSHRQILQEHVWHHKKRERTGPSRGLIQKCEPHERSPCAPRFEDRTEDETLHQERYARRVAWDLAKSVQKRINTEKATFLISCRSQRNARANFKISKGKRIRGGLRSIKAHAEQKRT